MSAVEVITQKLTETATYDDLMVSALDLMENASMQQLSNCYTNKACYTCRINLHTFRALVCNIFVERNF